MGAIKWRGFPVRSMMLHAEEGFGIVVAPNTTMPGTSAVHFFGAKGWTYWPHMVDGLIGPPLTGKPTQRMLEAKAEMKHW